MKLICTNCGKEFQPSHTVELRYIKNPNKNYFCSKSCAGFYNNRHKEKIKVPEKRNNKGQFIKQEIPKIKHKCTNCGKEYVLTEYQYKRYLKDNTCNLFCSKSCSAKYSNKHRSEEWKQTRKEVNKQLYGTEIYVNKEQISKTLKQKYENNEIEGFGSDKYKQTMLERYGSDNIGKTEWMKQHNLEKFGTEYYFQSKDYKQKTGRTNLKRYGTLYHMQNKEQVEKYRQTIKEKYGVNWITDVLEVQNKIKQGLRKTYTQQNDDEDTNRFVSKQNKLIGQMLEENNINFQYEFYIYPKWYDIKVNNTLIEVDPTVTHNIIFNPFGTIRPKTYHLEKTKLAKSNNFSCIHIFDWDDIDKIVDMLKPKEKLYARRLQIKEVNKQECNKFLNNYHLQNSCKGQTVRLGLYNNKELVQVLTFGKPRYNKHYEYELLRLCTKNCYLILGGVEKLFKYFIHNYNPKSIISYCDNSKFSGNVYKRLNFKDITTNKCSLHWYNPKTHRHITDNLLRQRGYSQLHNDNNYENYNKGDDNEKLMLENGYLPVYDCGQSTFVWKEE